MYEFWYGVENWPGFVAFNESLFAYPIVQGVHVLALGFAVGLLALADLRLAGLLFTGQPERAIVGSLRPWFIGGFAVVFTTGLLLFLAQATNFYNRPLFWFKLSLIAFAGLNALWFELGTRRAQRNNTAKPSATLAGLLSLAFWIAVVVLGRLLAYF